uniref:Transmembrane protein n=1 Tax=Cacopsylla melanoneura TaxID=428564 RepID=A0A8D8VK78_9HEMI
MYPVAVVVNQRVTKITTDHQYKYNLMMNQSINTQRLVVIIIIVIAVKLYIMLPELMNTMAELNTMAVKLKILFVKLNIRTSELVKPIVVVNIIKSVILYQTNSEKSLKI